MTAALAAFRSPAQKIFAQAFGWTREITRLQVQGSEFARKYHRRHLAKKPGACSGLLFGRALLRLLNQNPTPRTTWLTAQW
jgi:hypothetical protein